MTIKGRILVIDDEEIIVNLFKRFLSHQGYECVSASNGLDGVKTVE